MLRSKKAIYCKAPVLQTTGFRTGSQPVPISGDPGFVPARQVIRELTRPGNLLCQLRKPTFVQRPLGVFHYHFWRWLSQLDYGAEICNVPTLRTEPIDVLAFVVSQTSVCEHIVILFYAHILRITSFCPMMNEEGKPKLMNLSLGQHWDGFLGQLVASGRYSSASEAVRDGLRLLQSEEQKRLSLKTYLDEAIAKGGTHTLDDVDTYLEGSLVNWEQQQKPA